MEIKVIGKNSSNRIKLIKNLNKAMKNVDIDTNIEIIEDDKSLIEYQNIATPILMINSKIISNGKILTDKEIVKFINVLS